MATYSPAPFPTRSDLNKTPGDLPKISLLVSGNIAESNWFEPLERALAVLPVCHPVILSPRGVLAVPNDPLPLPDRKTADERLATFLLALAAEHHQTPGAQHVRAIHFAMLRQDNTDYLGLMIETISKTCERFKRKKGTN